MQKLPITKYLISFTIFIILLYFAQVLLVPKYASGIVEGKLIESYYEDHKDNDVIFIGDCEVYENFSPITLWQEYGITSYIRGSAQQLIWQSYYLMEEAIKTEKPKVIVFNVLSMKYNEPQKEAYNRMTLDGMKWSSAKVKSIQASMMADESFLDYVFPLLRYHSRWQELSADDVQYAFKNKKLFHNGYYMRADVKPMGTVPKATALADYKLGENSYKYLEMMYQLAEENDVELILIKAPTVYPVWHDEWDEQIETFAKERDLTYINFLDHMDQIGIDMQTDTYDAGLHLNVFGAEKLSRYFGKLLMDKSLVEDRRGDAVLEAVWREKIEFYNQMKQQQLDDIKKIGRITTYE